MIPLNKPFICKKNKKDNLNSFFLQHFPNYHNQIVFSAGQGLDIIYKEIYDKIGACNVAVSPLTCFEAIYPIINNKHKIIFVDIDPETFNMNESLITDEANVIQAIHLGGNPQRMDIITKKASEISAIIVEDCAQALGGTYKDSLLGTWGEYASFSFMKTIFALGGGFNISSNKMADLSFKEASYTVIIYRFLKRFLESKSSYDSGFVNFLLFSLLKLKPDSSPKTISKNLKIGVNSQIIKSINSQLGCYDFFLKTRIESAKLLLKLLSNKNLEQQKIVKGGQSNYTRLFFKTKRGNSNEYINKLRDKGISANHLSQNWLTSYQDKIYEINDFKHYTENSFLPEYNLIHDKILCIPISAGLSLDEIKYIAKTINEL